MSSAVVEIDMMQMPYLGEISSDLYRHKKLLPKLNHFDPLIVVGDLR